MVHDSVLRVAFGVAALVIGLLVLSISVDKRHGDRKKRLGLLRASDRMVMNERHYGELMLAPRINLAFMMLYSLLGGVKQTTSSTIAFRAACHRCLVDI